MCVYIYAYVYIPGTNRNSQYLRLLPWSLVSFQNLKLDPVPENNTHFRHRTWKNELELT